MFYADLNNYFKAGFKPMYGIDHDERNFKVSIQDGWDEQDDDWVKNNAIFAWIISPIISVINCLCPIVHIMNMAYGKMKIPVKRAGILNMVLI